MNRMVQMVKIRLPTQNRKGAPSQRFITTATAAKLGNWNCIMGIETQFMSVYYYMTELTEDQLQKHQKLLWIYENQTVEFSFKSFWKNAEIKSVSVSQVTCSKSCIISREGVQSWDTTNSFTPLEGEDYLVWFITINILSRSVLTQGTLRMIQVCKFLNCDYSWNKKTSN